MSSGATTESDAEARRKAVDIASRRARWACWVLAIGACRVVFEGLLDSAIHSPPRVGLLVNSAVQVVPAAVFLLWLHRAVENATLLGSPSGWRAEAALFVFLMPGVNLVLGYWPMKALFRASDPGRFPDAPVFREREHPDYRGGAREPAPPPRWRYPASALAWALLFGARPVPGFVAVVLECFPLGDLDTPGRAMVDSAILARVVDVAAAVACVLLVRSIDARQREQCRRLEAMQPSS